MYLIALIPVHAADSHKASNLTQSQKLIHEKQGKREWQQQMSGKTDDLSNQKLPVGVNRDELSVLLFGKTPAELKKSSEIKFLGAHQFPGRDGLFIGAGSISKKLRDSHYSEIQLCVFKLVPSQKPVLVAKTSRPLISSRDTMNPLDEAAAKAASDTLDFEDLQAFDLATFQISPTQFAFGLRTGLHEGYAGGIGLLEYLHLFVADGTKIKPVFGSLVYDFQNLAGDWHKDGTRERFVYEDKYVLSISKQLHVGHYDLQLRQVKGGKQSCRYAWDKESDAYLPVDKEPTEYYASEHSSGH
jgi:hypothetical protein